MLSAIDCGVPMNLAISWIVPRPLCSTKSRVEGWLLPLIAIARSAMARRPPIPASSSSVNGSSMSRAAKS